MLKKLILPLVFVFFGREAVFAQEVRERYAGLDKLLGEGSFFDNHFTGFMLYDLENKAVQFEKNSHLYFLPASTMKLFTFYASMMVLGDSTTLLRYVANDDEIVFWGTGDPSWRYERLPQPGLKAFFKPYDKITFSDSNWGDEAFGYGWQWDDYYFAYSAEKSPFPIYGNLVTAVNSNNKPMISPGYFGGEVAVSNKQTRNIRRDLYRNSFYYNPRTYNGRKYSIPFITSSETFVELASHELNKKVAYSKEALPVQHAVLKGMPIAPLYKEILQESDNFVSEQLMLMVSDELFKELNTEKTIEFIKKNFLFDLPDELQWVDGSGLSRHNLVTPRTMTSILEKIYQLLPDELLFDLFPKGGVNGTLKNNYRASTPYVFAKTGTLSNHHSLAGYLKTKSNKLYLFAFMNNNYPYRASRVRQEMEKVLVYIRDNY